MPPLVAHVLFRFATGGLENGVVNLINHMPPDSFRHAVIAVDSVDPTFVSRLRRPHEVHIEALHKPPGHGMRVWPRFAQLIRGMKPAIVHTRNLAALEMQLAAAWAGAPVRLHGEHGWDRSDPDGTRAGPRWTRRAYAPFVHRFLTVSDDLRRYLRTGVGIDDARIDRLYNGVDTSRFVPAANGPAPLAGCPFDPAHHWIVGTVGRLQAVKHQPLLVRAFAEALRRAPAMAADARLVIVGDGPLRPTVEAEVARAGLGDRVWLSGERRDVPEVMRALHLFALPSLAEGISNTVLEAMASGLPVVATRVGGNPELVAEGRTGLLVPSDDPAAMAEALTRLHADRRAAGAMATAARSEAVARFSLESMVQAYLSVYKSELARRRPDPRSG